MAFAGDRLAKDLSDRCCSRYAQACTRWISMTKGSKLTLANAMTTAFYPGSFDPMTNGHLDVLLQSMNFCSRVVVAIGIHPGKVPLFTFEERADLIRQAVTEAMPDKAGIVDVVSFSSLAVDAARANGATLLIR